MMNGVRGEAEVVLGGVRRRVCLTLGALAEMEAGLGVDGVAALAERMKRLSARDLTVVLTAVLRGGGEEAAADVCAAAEAREAVQAVAAAFAGAVAP